MNIPIFIAIFFSTQLHFLFPFLFICDKVIVVKLHDFLEFYVFHPEVLVKQYRD